MTDPTLLLWDIDHTLIETRGVGSELYRAAFVEVTGRKLEHEAEITGRTELAILAETLKLHGLEPSDEYAIKYATALARQYHQHADDLRQRGRILPGAREALAALADLDDIVQTVLTGNLRAVAATKLRVFGLDQYIDVEVGAHGDDEEDRPKLMTIAQQRAAAKRAVAFDRSNTIILGDSPSDVETGLEGGARVIAVASGKSSVEDLRKAGAGAVLYGLADTTEVVKTIGEVKRLG